MTSVDDSIKRICSENESVQALTPYITLGEEPLVYEENVVLIELNKDNKDKEFNFKKLQDSAKYYYAFQRDFPLVFHRVYGLLKKENVFTYDRMKELIKEDLKSIKERELTSYILYFPINVKPESKISKFELDDCEIDFVDSKILSETEEIKQEKQVSEDFRLSGGIVCKISLEGRNVQYAVMKSKELYEFILGLIGFYETCNMGLRIMGCQKPISKLTYHYDIPIFGNKKFIKSFNYAWTCERKTGEIKLNKYQVEKINVDVKRVIESEKRELIFNLYTAYWKGITEMNVDWSFLSFWRVIEFGIPSKKQFEIIQKLKALIKELKPSTERKIDRFYNLRNNFVHGTAYISECDRNSLKLFAQMIIDIHMRTLYYYSKEEIDLFYYYIERKNNVSRHLKMAEKVNSLMNQAREDIKNKG